MFMSNALETMFSPELILMDVEALDYEDLFRKASDYLRQKGYVTESFLDALLKREREYPTGLPTSGIKVALPHTDMEHALRSGILVLNLKKTVIFKEMGNNVRDIPAELVFVIVVNDAAKQVDILKNMVGMFADEQLLSRIKKAHTPQEAASLLQRWQLPANV
jgi:PTS system galactitol-specific IIA component